MPGQISRIPSLDGARALSVTLVILSHLQILGGVPLLWRLETDDFFAYGDYLDYGNLGVRVFFVISGFLITSLMIGEHERAGSIALGRFYLRRALRIMPPYLAYLVVIMLLIPTGRVPARWSEIPAALAYFSDYYIPHGALTHTWSLSVEEQFYLLWPPLILVLGLRRAHVGCVLVLIAAPIFRVLSDSGVWPTSAKFSFESSADALAVGCLLALLRARLWQWERYRQMVSSRVPWLLPLCALLLMGIPLPFVVRDVVAIPLLNIGVAILLDRHMRFPGSVGGRILNLAPLVWLGTLSYSLYLWQQLFAFTSYPLILRVTAILVFAMASYYLLERPLLELRGRLRAAPVFQDSAVGRLT